MPEIILKQCPIFDTIYNDATDSWLLLASIPDKNILLTVRIDDITDTNEIIDTKKALHNSLNALVPSLDKEFSNIGFN